MDDVKVYTNDERRDRKYGVKKGISKKEIHKEPLKVYSEDEVKDIIFGKVGTLGRDVLDRQLVGMEKSYEMGLAIRQARLSKKLTQAQLGKLIGVKEAQVSRIEKGSNMTISTICRIFNALEIHVSVNVEGVCAISLC